MRPIFAISSTGVRTERRRIDVGDRDRLRRGTTELALDGLEVRHVPDLRPDVVGLRAQALQDAAHPIAEEPRVDDDDAIPRLDDVGDRELHRQRARARDDERLAAWSLEDLSHSRERSPERAGKIGVHVAGRRATHGREDLRLELDGPWNHQEGTLRHGAAG